jgi:G6PDH family F420-dependent oxidoreductase
VTRLGYSLLCEQSGPRDLVRDAARAEEAGFDFEVISDHFSPWLDAQGHAPNAWATLGAVAQVTERVGLHSYVTCPTMRYHPAVVAQQAATVDLLSGGRFSLGLGAGENLNEHVIGRGWSSASVRHEMLDEAVQVIRALLEGHYVDFVGSYFRVEGAKIWDVGSPPPKIGVAVSGPRSCELAGRQADYMIAVAPEASLGEQFDVAGGAGKPRVGQLPVSWDPSREVAARRAHEQFRWFAGGWKVNSELPGTAGFAAATAYVRPEDVAAAIPCGPDVEAFVEAVRAYVAAGFTDVAVVQVGGETQQDFLAWAERELLPALRESG